MNFDPTPGVESVCKEEHVLASKLWYILTGRTDEFETDVKDISMLILTYGKNITQTNIFHSIDGVPPIKT